MSILGSLGCFRYFDFYSRNSALSVLHQVVCIAHRTCSINIAEWHARRYNLRLFAQLSALFTLEKVLNVFGVVSDFAIAGSLIFYLQRSRTGFKRSESIVNKLIIFSINTGAVTSLCAIMALIFVSRRFFATTSFPPHVSFSVDAPARRDHAVVRFFDRRSDLLVCRRKGRRPRALFSRLYVSSVLLHEKIRGSDLMLI